MENDDNHIIRRQVIEVEVPSVESAWRIQDRISQLYRYELTRILEEVFAGIANPGEVLRIDRLEVDLGNIKPDALEEDIIAKLREKLHEQLSIAAAAAASGITPAAAPGEAELKAKAVRYSQTELLYHFLLSGTVPWWYKKSTFGSIASVAEKVIREKPTWCRLHLVPLLASAEVRRRFVQHLPDEQLSAFIRLRSDAQATTASTVFEPLSKAVLAESTRPAPAVFRLEFWDAVLSAVLLEKQDALRTLLSRRDVITPAARISRQVPAINQLAELAGITKTFEAEKLAVANLLPGEEQRSPKSSPRKTNQGEAGGDGSMPTDEPENEEQGTQKKGKKKLVLRKKRVKPARGEDEKTDEAGDLQNGDVDSPGITGSETKTNIDTVDPRSLTEQTLQPQTELPQKDAATLQDKKQEEEKLKLASAKRGEDITTDNGKEEFVYEISEEDLCDFTVGNAGVVLLWPYLKPYFTELGLLNGRAFADKAAQHRAIHLVQYLAAGDNTYEEHDLVFIKILCGVDLTEPIDMHFEITEREIEESEGLLRAVIDNWKAIGKTSINSLRGTFLHREGALKKTDQGWQLNIERTTIDILLDRLPWGLSIIRLPWCEEMIYVEW